MSYEYNGHTINTSNTTVYTFTNHAIGTAASDRLVVVAVKRFRASGTVDITGVTIGGVAAARVTDGVQAATVGMGANATGVELWALTVTTGTTATIVVTFGAGANNCSIAVYSLYGLTSTTPEDVQVDAATAYSLPFTNTAGGIVIAAGMSTAVTTATWAGATEDYDVQSEAAMTYSGASAAGVGANVTVTPTFSSETGLVVLGAVWGVTVNPVLAADSGSYAVTGTAATPKHGRIVAADSGSYAVSGAAATLLLARKLAAGSGSYALTGTDASLEHGRILVADPGSYALSGNSADLEYGFSISAASGSYGVTGADAALVKTWIADAETGSYLIAGAGASLEYGYKAMAETGSYLLAGSEATLEGSFFLGPADKLKPSATTRYKLAASPATAAKQKPSTATRPSLTSRLQ